MIAEMTVRQRSLLYTKPLRNFFLIFFLFSLECKTTFGSVFVVPLFEQRNLALRRYAS